MKFYWCPRTRAFRIAWLLEELGQPYERVVIDIHDEASRADPGFRAVSPMGKVPAIEDGHARLWDSGAIAVYLADTYPDAGLGAPIGSPARAAFLQWALFTNSVIEPAMDEKFRGEAPKPLQRGYGSFDLMLGTLESGLVDGPWLLGDRFTAADVLVGTAVHFMQLLGELQDPPTVIAAYVDRCRARPAFARAQAFEPAA